MPLGRRKFVATNAAICSGLVFGSNLSANAQDELSAERLLIQLGTNALARAASMKYFADGHRGASMISASMMCSGNDFEETTVARISELFNSNWASGPLCKDFPLEDPDPNAIKRVGQTLAEHGNTLREVGHDAIFAMHAIKAFRLVPELATPNRVDGICDLIRAFKPWRDVDPDPSIELPEFANQQEVARFILREASNAIDRFIGYGQGFAGHMLTFGQSLVELAHIGDVELAESCRTAFLKYVTVTRKGPQAGDRKIKEHAFTKLRPADGQYWQKRNEKSLGLGHVFKYPYAYYDLLEKAQSPELEADFEAKAWRLF